LTRYDALRYFIFDCAFSSVHISHVSQGVDVNADEKINRRYQIASHLLYGGVFRNASIDQNALPMRTLRIALVLSCSAASTPALAECPEMPLRVANASLDDFISAPQSLLSTHHTAISRRTLVRTLLLLDTERTLPALMKIILLASSDQQAEIVDAMASVIDTCANSRPRNVLLIRDTLNSLTDNGSFGIFDDTVHTNDNIQPTAADPRIALPPMAAAKNGPFGAATTDSLHRFKVSNGKLWNPFAPMRIPAPLEGVRKLH
jgi:hypothetical protein